MAMGFNHTVYPLMNVSLSCEDILDLEGKKQKMTFSPFGNAFLSPPKNIILKGHPILYPLK